TEYQYIPDIDSILHIGFADGWYYFNRINNLYRTKDFIDIETLYVSSGTQTGFQYYFQWTAFGGYIYATRYQYFSGANRRYQLVRSLSGVFDDVEIIVNYEQGAGGLMYWMNV